MTEKPRTKTRTVIVVDNSHVARRIGDRIKHARQRASMTQRELARGRYTAAYISALERGLAKPSMAALNFIGERLGVTARELFGEDEGPAAGRLEADLLLAAGAHREALARYRPMLDRSPPAGTRAAILVAMAEALCRSWSGEEATRAASEAAQLFDAANNAQDAAHARYWLAYGHYLQDNTAEARGLLRELLDAPRDELVGEPAFRFRVLAALGNVESWDGQPEQAIAYMEEARGMMGDLSLAQRARFLAALAQQYRQAGDLERSIRTGTESLDLYRAADLERDAASLEVNMALAFLTLGNADRAAEHVARARDVADRSADVRLESEVAEAEARLALHRGDHDAARERIHATLDAVERGGSFLAGVGAYVTRARMASAAGDADGAEASFNEAVALLRRQGLRSRLREVLGEWAEVRAGRGDLVGATELYAEALGRVSSTRAQVADAVIEPRS